MADYKVVDAGKLDGDLTVLAEAIRQRSGTDGKLEFPDGMAETVRNIPSDGIQLPELSSPASPDDMVQGKELYDDQGNKITGSVNLFDRLVFSKYAATEDGIISSLEADVDEDWLTLTTPPNDRFRFMLERGGVVEAGVFLSDLGDVQPGDVVEGKTFTSAAGLKVPGTIKEGNRYFYSYNGGVVAYPEDGALVFDHTFTGDCYYRAGEVIQLFHSDLGDAIAEDVAKGKTFTTAAGVKMKGTMEPGSGGGLPAGITEIQTGSWTQATNDSSGSFTIPHGCSKTPRFIIVNSDYATSGASYSNAVQIAATVCNDDGGFSGGYQLGGASQSNTNNTNVKWDDTNMTFTHWSARRWRQGNTYTWYAICVDNWEGL